MRLTTNIMTNFQLYCLFCSTYRLLKHHKVDTTKVDEHLKKVGIKDALFLRAGYWKDYEYVLSQYKGISFSRDMNYCLYLMGVYSVFEKTYNKQKAKGTILFVTN